MRYAQGMKTPTLFLMCGLPGSGKTTLAQMLEREKKALRLTPDEWMDRIVGDGYDERKREVVETLMKEIAERGLELGINVILDFGFWSRAERDTLREFARGLGASIEIHLLNVSTEELQRRLKIRNDSSPEYTFHVTEESLTLWESWFEIPNAEEMSFGDVVPPNHNPLADRILPRISDVSQIQGVRLTNANAAAAGKSDRRQHILHQNRQWAGADRAGFGGGKNDAAGRRARPIHRGQNQRACDRLPRCQYRQRLVQSKAGSV